MYWCLLIYAVCCMISFSVVDLDLPAQISLGDVQSNYLLTTAENELGVVVAHSEAGKVLLA